MTRKTKKFIKYGLIAAVGYYLWMRSRPVGGTTANAGVGGSG